MSPHNTLPTRFAVLTETAGQVAFAAVDAAGRAFGWIETAFQVNRERRDLARLDDRMLKDIGLDQGRAWREWSRDFTDLPKDRRS